MNYSFLLYGLHSLFAAVVFVGAVLFILWANKLKADELKKWVTWLLVVGVVGMLLLSAFGPGKGVWGPGMKLRDGSGYNYGNMENMMDEMMDFDDAN